ncbi:TPA: MerR family DNA-binding transcriptional regulator [Vibrio parahaemolyticus]|uniref:MerR family transcriptional regulator n=1 Tax=Vibrio parahaemolyticus TaxID=670 RepID=UPI0018697D3F|nr:MerR family DNA-binding transcriptional regulator [Vibrio parahaemolyticus]MBE4436682.1 MerR family DNA-binding transcriptional regulator [Vibrio parahaemolyticus]MBM4903666.1 MerR family DNA-binding transcriptional regulator [Vibrio parahaemolyticus]MCR9881338.1 MerR family DNA-binding transcriptional regulator [Vibrio parahaemolyticus]MCR9896154.1 MerR family DNA-binding transcriptional regulator [Vibrio parahaemolyticus]MCR9956623.1 MerR family DNA-binding transcriptional regulator [Vibr
MNTFKISELAKEFDITTRSIRFYEDLGLLTPERKGNTRIYNGRDRIRLKLILRGKRLGFSLADIKELFELYDTDQSTEQLNYMIRLIEDKKAALQQQANDIQAVMMELNAAQLRCQNTLRSMKGEKVT